MDFVLQNNIFNFNDCSYLQKEGTAIGSKLGRNYACTYLGAWEQELLSSSDKKPTIFLRYIDDIWGVWEHSQEELKLFVEHANSIHKNIQLDLRFSNEEIEFLDVNVRLTKNNTFSTKIFEKKSSGHIYVHNSSCHPKITKQKIAYGLGIRARRICSREEDFNAQKKMITKRLMT